jgi:hypothetical protein
VAGSFDVGLVQISALEAATRAAFGAFGSDPLASGRVHVENDAAVHEMQANINGALANSTYAVLFCSFSTGLAACSTVAQVTTNGQGNGEGNMSLAGGPFAGIFLVQRAGTNQFVTGFPNGQQGFKVSLEPAGAISGGLGAGFSLGTDTLREGSVTVQPGVNRAQVDGAAASATYAITFCRFGAGAAGCVAAGTLTTNTEGDGQTQLSFAPSAPVAGVFVFSRTVNGAAVAELVTGFRP